MRTAIYGLGSPRNAAMREAGTVLPPPVRRGGADTTAGPFPVDSVPSIADTSPKGTSESMGGEKRRRAG